MTSDSSHSSDKDWSPSPERSTYRQPPVMEIGIKCQNKPPVRLKSDSLCPQSHPKMIGVTCEEKPPVRLKSVSAPTQPPRNITLDKCSTTSSHASMCSRPTHKKIGIGCADKPPVRLKCVSLHPQSQLIGIRCQNKPPVRLKRASLHPQAHIGIKCQEKPTTSLHPHAHIGIKCQEKPPVRLKTVSSCAQPCEEDRDWMCRQASSETLKSFKIYRMDRDPEQLISEHLNQFSKVRSSLAFILATKE